MKKVILALALSAMTLPVLADLKSDIVTMNAKVSKALKAKDFKAFAAATQNSVTKDFKHVENGQSMDYKTMLAMVKESFGMMEKMESVSVKVLSVTEKGNTGTSKENHHMAGTMKMPDGKSHKVVFDGITICKYVKQNGKWMMSRMEWSGQKMLMDGKPFDPTKMAPPPGKGGK